MNYPDKILKILNPTPAVAGLEISDFYLRFYCGEGKSAIVLEERLTPGVVKEGKILNNEKFKESLNKIKLLLGGNFKKIFHLIVTLPSSTVYLQTFSLPYLTGEKLTEAAKLNLQMLTPLPPADTYADWDLLLEEKSGELKILGAFTEKSNVENVIKICRELGFVVLAIEPSIQALARSIFRFILQEVSQEPYLILNVSSEGMDFAGVKDHKIYFQYFISWFSMYSGATEIAPRIFEDTVNRYVEQVINFASSHWNFELKKVILTASELKGKISEIIEKKFKLNIYAADFGNFSPGVSFAPALGAYLRGLLPRSEDKLISLTPIGTEEEFKQSELLLFVELWRNIIVTWGVALLLVFITSYFLLGKVGKGALAQNAERIRPEEASELITLKAKAESFNRLVNTIKEASKSGKKIDPHFLALERALQDEVVLTRVAFQSFSAPVIIAGLSAGEAAITNFKRRLEAAREFSGVVLPLNSIVPAGGGKTSFSVSLNFVP